MALPATDAFTGTNGTQLTTYSGNWTLNSGDFDIQSNALAPDSAGNECGAHWDADAFGADQYAEGVYTRDSSTTHAAGVAVRCNTGGAATYYGLYADGGTGGDCYLYKMVAGSWTQLGSTTNITSGVTLRLEAEGTTLTPLYNGSTTGTPGAQTDSAISSGAAGVSGYADGTTITIDTWEGGNLGGGPAPATGYMTTNTGYWG